MSPFRNRGGGEDKKQREQEQREDIERITAGGIPKAAEERLTTLVAPMTPHGRWPCASRSEQSWPLRFVTAGPAGVRSAGARTAVPLAWNSIRSDPHSYRAVVTRTPTTASAPASSASCRRRSNASRRQSL